MKKDCENRYKLCRINAGFTQAYAAELLHISERSLSDYENSKTKVPDDVVDAMAEHYNAPILAWWHIKETSVLGKWLPDIVMPQTFGDMAFQLVLAEDELSPVVNGVKKIVSTGTIAAADWHVFGGYIKLIKQVNGKLLSVVAYAEQEQATERQAI